MKRIVISVVIMVVVLGYCIFADKIISAQSREITALNTAIEAAAIAEEWETAEILSFALIEESENYMKRINFFVRDDRLNSLEQCARRILPLAQTKNSEILIETAVITEEIQSYADAERFNWYNLI
ncbi:MAG: DUF4363 family protein [Ruminococcus sp.]|nr:DUF4363 family protein [Ruminococcus sp.]